MVFRSLLFSAVLALKAGAFLVVPEVDGDVIAPEAVQSLAIDLPTKANLTLVCAECPFPEVSEDGEVSWTSTETGFSLSFLVQDGMLIMNGDPIFPGLLPINTLGPYPYFRTSDNLAAPFSHLGYMLEERPLPAEPDGELFSIRFSVLALYRQSVSMDSAIVTVIRAPSGDLYIAQTDIEKANNNKEQGSQCSSKLECAKNSLLDRVAFLLAAAKETMASFGSRIAGSKGCHRGPHSEAVDDDVAFHPDGRHEHQRFHPGPHRPHHMPPNSWARSFSRIVRFILVPAVLGVLAGMTASALGMLVGQVVVFFWLRYRRARQPSQHSPATVEHGTVREKQSLMSEIPDELPPEYTDEEFTVSPDGKV